MATEIHPGARYYGRITLPIYDAAVLGVAVPYGWGCPLAEERAMYDRCVGARHLDVGVASGYFMDRATWPVEKPAITLMDLNPNATQYAAHRLRRYNITEVVGDALDPFPVDGKFDSIGMMHLLHCMPGSIPEKAQALDHAAAVLAPGGVVFGANVTPLDCPTNPLAQGILAFSHYMGALNNARDSHADMRTALETRFKRIAVTRRGCMTLWEARHPR